jgi:hypothetical protein
MLADTLWGIVRWSVPLTLAGVVAAVAVGSRRIDDEVRRRVEARLAEELPGMRVGVQSATLVPGEGIVLRGLAVAATDLPPQHRQLLWVEELRLACATGLADLLSGRTEVTAIRVRRPTLHMVRLADGSWPIARLFKSRSRRGTLPETVSIEDASILVEDAGTLGRTQLRRLHAMLEREPGDAGFRMRGTSAGEAFQHASFAGRVDLKDRQFALAGSVSTLELSERTAGLLPSAVRACGGLQSGGPAAKAAGHSAGVPAGETCRAALPMRQIADWAGGLHGRADLDWQVGGGLDDLAGAAFVVSGRLEGGRYEHATLPFALADVHAVFRADRTGGAIESLTARSGSAVVDGSGRWQGWAADSDFSLALDVRQLIVGRHWEPFLPALAADQWRKVLPVGEVDLHARLERTAGSLRPELSIRCRNLSLTHYRFPYRLDRTVGTVTLEGDAVALHLVGQAGGRPVRVEGRFSGLANAAAVPPSGFVEVTGEDIGVDEHVLSAMPPGAARLVRSLRVGGRFGFVFRHERGNAIEGGRSTTLGIRVTDGSLAYAGFPYPLSRVSGGLRMRDGRWEVVDVTGSNDSGIVRCSGTFGAAADGEQELLLRFAGSRLALEDELRDALPAAMRRVWDDISPRGLVDVTAVVRHRVGNPMPRVELEATPHGQTVSIEPAWFPYRLERLDGRLFWADGTLRFEGVRGMHDRTTLAADGTCRFLPDGGWHVSFASLAAERFRADHELLAALPAGLRDAIVVVRPGGLLSLGGSLDLYAAAAPEADGEGTGSGAGAARPGPPGARAERPPVAAAWDLHVDIQQGSLDVGLPLEHVHGGIHLVGRSDGRNWTSRGDLSVDSLICRGVQVTAVSGPVTIDPAGVRFGAAAPGGPAGRLTARVGGGVVEADGLLTSDGGGFEVLAEVRDASLERLVAEALGAAHAYRGRLDGSIRLEGSRAGTHALSGHGGLRLREAAIHELPLVVAMLKLLRVRLPDRNAFGSCQVDFRVEGPHAYLDTVELSGDAVSLVGNGELDFDGSVHMTFRSIMGDSREQLPIMKRLVGGASGQFMLIHVDGQLTDPEMTTEAFPTLNAALQRLQATGRDRRGMGVEDGRLR